MPLLENIRIDQVLFALISAIDMTDNRLRLHSHRVAYISIRLGILLGFDHASLNRLLMASVLHDIGILSESEKSELSQLEVPYKNTVAHCIAGSRLLEGIKDLSHLSEIVKRHHEPYNSRGGSRDDILCSIIHLADRVSITVGAEPVKRSRIEWLTDWLSKNSGLLFDPKVVEAFFFLSEEAAFWLDVSTDYVYERCQEYAKVLNTHHITDIMNVGLLFAEIIDMRSPFTVRHSILVSNTAERLGARMGFSKEECRILKLAGLLHDLGKLAIPNRILEKEGSLSEEEREIIRSHTYFTYNILNKIEGMERIKIWAAYHHERMDGSGYPFRLRGQALPLGSKIMAVADVYSALAEKRPYKDPFPPERVIGIMKKSSVEGGLDPQVVDAMIDLLQKEGMSESYDKEADSKQNREYQTDNIKQTI